MIIILTMQWGVMQYQQNQDNNMQYCTTNFYEMIENTTEYLFIN